jgi:hypothetical protein
MRFINIPASSSLWSGNTSLGFVATNLIKSTQKFLLLAKDCYLFRHIRQAVSSIEEQMLPG